MKNVFYCGTRNASSWSLRAWLALREQGIDFEERIVDLRKPQRFDELKKVGEFSPPAAVPTLVTGDGVIFDSLAIMEYANDCGPTALLPADTYLRARARSFLAWQHSGLSGLCPRLSFESAFYPERRAMTPDEVADSERLFRAFEDELAAHGGPYLFGALSLPDLALVPTVIRIAAHDPDLARWPLTAAWMEALLARPAVEHWLHAARDLPPVWLDDYE